MEFEHLKKTNNPKTAQTSQIHCLGILMLIDVSLLSPQQREGGKGSEVCGLEIICYLFIRNGSENQID